MQKTNQVYSFKFGSFQVWMCLVVDYYERLAGENKHKMVMGHGSRLGGSDNCVPGRGMVRNNTIVWYGMVVWWDPG